MDESVLRNSLIRNCKEVFSTMLSLDISETMDGRESTASDISERVIALIGFGGDYTGNCVISCSGTLARRFASAMLMEEYEAVTAEVMDAMGEISNMIFGNVKADLEEDLGPLQLSIPTVIVGREFNVRSLANPSWIVIPMKIEDHAFEARMCVSLDPGKSGRLKSKAA